MLKHSNTNLKTLIASIAASLAEQEKTDDFYHDVASLDQAVRLILSKTATTNGSDLEEAKAVLMKVWKSNHYCRFSGAPKAAPPTYLRTKSSTYHRTSADEGGSRPILVWGGAFEMNRHRH